MPLCQSLASKLSPLTPKSHSKSFKVETWNDKSAWAATLPGAQIRLRFTGSWFGLFVYVTNGNSPHEQSSDINVRRQNAPGTAICWIEDVTGSDADDEVEDEPDPEASPERAIYLVNSHFPNRAAAGFECAWSLFVSAVAATALTGLVLFRFIELADNLSPGEHILACEISKETTSGGHKWRVQGIASL